MEYWLIFIVALMIGFVSMTAHDLGVEMRYSESGPFTLAGWMFTGIGWVGYVLAAVVVFILVTWLLTTGLEWFADALRRGTRWFSK